ncbi:hypothetical protein CF651_10300 [Paenibacillus rigui]|uniref:Uncharacterized protein n=1 Tax=Paenibacillus rigui TaxID=554312 RepID=A0A229URS0_9BACL|nr:hypothetical protein CF651_10300 [Paenibacillus rigui]
MVPTRRRTSNIYHPYSPAFVSEQVKSMNNYIDAASAAAESPIWPYPPTVSFVTWRTVSQGFFLFGSLARDARASWFRVCLPFAGFIRFGGRFSVTLDRYYILYGFIEAVGDIAGNRNNCFFLSILVDRNREAFGG